MKYLALSGNFSPVKETPKESFLTSIQESKLVNDYANKSESTANKKLKLGPDEHEFTFNLTIDNDKIPVRVYLQLSLDGNTVELIESFTGLDQFIDIEKYENKLHSLLNEAIQNSFYYELSIDAKSSDYKNK